MRMLAIGYPLPNAAIDNYNILSAPAFFDYDAVLIDPASITKVAAQLTQDSIEFEAFDGRPVVNAPSTATAISAADQIRRRADETQRLLEAGGLVFVIARPNAVQSGVYGFEGCDRYSWLPAPAGLSWSPPFLRAAEGKSVRVVAEDHPLANFFREFRSDISYRAYFEDHQAPVRSALTPLAAAGAGAWIAVEFPVARGRVIFIPPAGEDSSLRRPEIAQALVDAGVRLLNAPTIESAPYWTRTLAIPGLEQLEAELETSQTAATAAQAQFDTVRERVDVLARHRRLLYEEGQPFLEATIDALRLIGFAVVSQPGEPLVIENEGEQALVDLESSRETVVEWPYVRLQRRLEERLLKQGENRKGIVIVNGFRNSAPESRGAQFTDALRIACENYRYSLVTAQTLFGLVQRALGGANEATLSAIRRRVLRANGLLEFEAAITEDEENPEAGPLF